MWKTVLFLIITILVILFYFFSVSATGQWFNWSVMGAILLMMLFLGSSNFSESITAGKYPDYQYYKNRIPRFFPCIRSYTNT